MKPESLPLTNKNYCILINIMAKFGCSSTPLHAQIKCLENVETIYYQCLKSNKTNSDKN